MATRRDDDTNHASLSARVSLRTAVLLGALGLFGSGGINACTTDAKQEQIMTELRELNTRVSRIEGALSPRHAAVEPSGGRYAAH